MDANDLKAILQDLAVAFPGTTVSPDMAELWAKYLPDLDAQAGRAAADAWIRTQTRFPSISEFRGECGSQARLARQEKAADEVIRQAPRDRFGEKNVEAVREALDAALNGDEDYRLPVLHKTEVPRRGHGCVSGYVESATGGGMMPCRVCNYPAYERWASGAYQARREIPG